MRPQVLFPLFSDLSNLKGVGPAMMRSLNLLLRYKPVIDEESRDERKAVVRDLLFHMPTGCVDRRTVYKVAEAPIEQTVTVLATIQVHHPSQARRGGRRSPYRVTVSDETGDMQLVFFNPKGDYLSRILPEGQPRVISGRLELYDGVRQMTHPDMMVEPEKLDQVARLEPSYPLAQGLSQRQLGKVMSAALGRLGQLPEWLEGRFSKDNGWLPWHESIGRMHQPEQETDILPTSVFRQRLAYDELLAHQLALALVRERTKKQEGIQALPRSSLRDQLVSQLPFALTDGQQQVLAEIDDDLTSGHRMLRLLQGDVGSGKTIVALLAMMPVIEVGHQVALMVPTEILGRQHLQSIEELIAPLGLNVAILTGRMGVAARKDVMKLLADGAIHIVIGTHALFQESVVFHKLGLVVIDEQHRFGVNQRLALSEKGEHPHVLLMTATPIPRSLTMTAYGDMDCSLLTEKPAGRPRIDTRAVPIARIDEVVEGLKRATSVGSKVYWICPLVEGSDPTNGDFEGDLAAAEERHRVFQGIFGDRVALAHGKMKSDERGVAMRGFAGDAYDILVATTVVEVGVNVPDATIIVIEHAERFGLAQLHQLRGRVGRSDRPSSCILLYSPKCSEYAKKRLEVIRESDDGFYIAEEDLILRGAGDVLGTRQSGVPDFHFADMMQHRELVLAARDDVKLILHRDARLESQRGVALKVLLYLFEYDASLRFLEAG